MHADARARPRARIAKLTFYSSWVKIVPRMRQPNWGEIGLRQPGKFFVPRAIFRLTMFVCASYKALTNEGGGRRRRRRDLPLFLVFGFPDMGFRFSSKRRVSRLFGMA
jgi:hypothetical protein